MTRTTAALGSTGATISRLGLGSWATGGAGWVMSWGEQDDDRSIATVDRAVAAGINWIDTAPVYGLGHAEEVLARALRRLPAQDRPYVFTKCGLVWTDRDSEPRQVLAPASIRRECEDSLRRLGVDRLDLLQIHWPAHDGTAPEESWATMAALVDEGKVRWIGVSNYGVDLLERCEAVRHVDTVQPVFSLIERGTAADVLPWCLAHGTGVVVYSPLASGLLTGGFPPERLGELDSQDWRKRDPRFSVSAVEAAHALVGHLAPIALRHGVSIPEVAIAWILAWPGVTGAIVGARGPEQVDGWARAGALQLDEVDLDDIAAALQKSGAGSGPTRPPAGKLG